MDSVRAKIKRRFSHKNEDTNFDDHDDSGDEETQEYVNKEADEAEKEGYDTGRPGSLLNRMISHGNKKTEDQLAREYAAANPEAGGTNKVVTQR
ncbi:hypothetical protein PV10_04720 [Exophiala mesophila]|uniref:Uncharacterized protein n=1 Tax=Exophiala mesophila TaxID=212818 RepID=A0A0D1ZI36_EXOME|nr:uncharacterized protein PV10_04720 [Exophiala mesophila]KIV93509.1 hypothetical protein PV10_04720 [Exophiala mesophila]